MFVPLNKSPSSKFFLQSPDYNANLSPASKCEKDDKKTLIPPPPTFEDLEKFKKEMQTYLKNREDDLKESAGNLKHQVEFQLFAQGFNRRFKPRPYFVVYCRSTEDVQAAFNATRVNNIPIRIRSSGHDHEGESSGNNLVVIDVSNMSNVSVRDGIAHIGPGNIFKKLTTALANQQVMIPHGTCGTVAIAGFTMGGGWGPYTRSEGMCCEYLVGATVILGDGTRIDVDDKEGEPLPELLWALRGGGGFSYGLVTELRIKTFPIADELIRFKITWNPYPDQLEEIPTEHPDYLSEDVPTLKVLKMWEKSILSSDTPSLTGTNLMVEARPRGRDQIDYKTACNNCIMYGYWEGNEKDLRKFVKEWYGKYKYHLEINPDRGGRKYAQNEYGNNLMSDWARIPTTPRLRALAAKIPNIIMSEEKRELLLADKPFPPDVDTEAPHKITSRLVDKVGLQEEGYKAYIESMWSENVLPGNRKFALNQYTTLGAIVGDYYKKNLDYEQSAFPYKDKLYTIQYQTWWNADIADQVSEVYTRTNRALDWMEEVRDYDIPNTSGAFISFKDSSIPTETYFQQNYKRLIQSKKLYSEDPCNYFRSRKTII